jgi:hypothetical protein
MSRRRAREVMVVLVVGVAALATAASAAAPGAVLDQSNPPDPPPACGADAWANDTAADWSAQTFTAGMTGSLTNVDVSLFGSNPSFVLAITPVDASGAPVVGSPLASQAMTRAPGPTSVSDVLFATPAWVVAGTQYAIVLTEPNENGPGGGPFLGWTGDLGSSQSFGGPPCPNGRYTAGRAWATSAGSFGPDADFFFQTFVVAAKHVTVTKSGSGSGTVSDAANGIACGSTCTVDLKPGTQVTLTAAADPGSAFTGWSGGACSGTGACSFTAAADTSVTATFVAKATLTVHTKGAGKVTSRPAGIACGRTCSHAYLPGPVTLVETPAKGWHFLHWLGACHGSKATCRLQLQGGTTVASAAFAKNKKKKKK